MTPVTEDFYQIPISRFLSIPNTYYNSSVILVFLDVAGPRVVEWKVTLMFVTL